MEVKPLCKLIGVNGNVFVLAGHVRKALIDAGQDSKAEKFMEELKQCEGYDCALVLMLQYVRVY